MMSANHKAGTSQHSQTADAVCQSSVTGILISGSVNPSEAVSQLSAQRSLADP